MPIKGVRYNFIRLPLSGGKGTIVQKKGSKNVAAETSEQYYARLGSYIEAEPETYLMRWQIVVSPNDIATFRRECLDPILTQLCDWWVWVTRYEDPYKIQGDKYPNRVNSIHWRMPYGSYSSIMEGAVGDLDGYLDTGSRLGLTQTDDLFPELK